MKLNFFDCDLKLKLKLMKKDRDLRKKTNNKVKAFLITNHIILFVCILVLFSARS